MGKIHGEKVKSKKILWIICGTVIVCIILIGFLFLVQNKKRENYNQQFLKYQENVGNDLVPIYTIKNVEQLINTAIKNNESNKKVTIIYQTAKYTSPEELENLLSKLDTHKEYKTDVKYDDNNEIEFITLDLYTNYELNELKKYEGTEISGREIKSLFQEIESEFLGEEVKPNINIVYSSKDEQITSSFFNTDSTKKIKEMINSTLKYELNIQINTDNTCNILITANY